MVHNLIIYPTHSVCYFIFPKDALYLDTSHSRFGNMASCGQMVKVGFVSDVDGLYFHKRFKGSGHPFYESVYEKAAKIDKGLADNMDTCIIK